ncbi:MAG: heme o synthase [Alphaproteobacteria bacterium]
MFKLRIGLAVTLSAVAGMATVPGPVPEAWRIAVVAAAVLLASSSAGAFNQIAERDLDARMRRTRGRPFVTGRYAVGPLWYGVIVGLLAVGVGAAALALNGLAALNVFLGAFVYGVVYTLWLKRRTWWNIVVGGLAGSFAVLAGATALDAGPTPAGLALAVVLFLWTPPHFWSLATVLKDDYAAAGVPMLPAVVGERRAARAILLNTALLVVASLVPFALGLGPVYLACAVLGGSLFLWRAWVLTRDPSRANAMRCFLASLVQLVLVLAGTMLGGWLGA